MAEDFETPSEGQDAAEWLQDLSGEDEFESLRRKSARTSAIYEDMDTPHEADSGSAGSGFLGRFTASQRLILAILVFLNVLAFGCALLVMTGQITLFN